MGCVSREGCHPGSLLSVPHCGRVSSLHKWKSPESSRRGTHTAQPDSTGPGPTCMRKDVLLAPHEAPHMSPGLKGEMSVRSEGREPLPAPPWTVNSSNNRNNDDEAMTSVMVQGWTRTGGVGFSPHFPLLLFKKLR